MGLIFTRTVAVKVPSSPGARKALSPRMERIRVVEDRALPEKEAAGGGELDLSQYSIHTFGMYNGPLRQLDIRFDDRLADVFARPQT